MRSLILAQSDSTARVLATWLGLLDDAVLHDSVDDIVVGSADYSREGGTPCYQQVAWKIATALERRPNRLGGEFAIAVDCVSPTKLSAVGEGLEWDQLVALLILTFPEVKWVFGILLGETDLFPSEDHSLKSLFSMARRDPLFDPTGLRDWVREITNKRLKESHDLIKQSVCITRKGLPLQLPRRRKGHLAAAVDDEIDYATMHGYAAYRYGYRADIITSWELMAERFGRARSEVGFGHGYRLLMENMRLTFPDKPAVVQLSRLGSVGDEWGRDHHCPHLHWENDDSNWRFLITTGQMGLDNELLQENRNYLAAKKPPRIGALCYKPLGGLCDIWTRTGLRRSGEHASSPRGNAQGFVWPPEEFVDDLHDGHGAPGKLGMVARILIERSVLAKGSASSASDWIKASLLASDAAELLGGKTPTLTLTALGLKHEFEVRAECTFIGAGFHFGLKQRFREIAAEVRSVCRWFEKKQTQASRDANATIINRLKLVFSEVGQLEEEEICLVKLRSLNRKMSRPKGFQRISPIHWFAHGVLAYGELLLVSFARLVTMTSLWAIVIWRIQLDLVRMKSAGTKVETDGYEVGSTIVGWFFGGNGAERELDAAAGTVIFGLSPHDMSHILSWIAVSLGVLHVGILMSYLYSLISRK